MNIMGLIEYYNHIHNKHILQDMILLILHYYFKLCNNKIKILGILYYNKMNNLQYDEFKNKFETNL